QQVFAQRAANAAIAHLDQLLLGARQTRAAFANQRGIDIDLRHVVDDDGDAPAFAVVEQMIEQGSLAGTEKAGQDGNGETVHVFLRNTADVAARVQTHFATVLHYTFMQPSCN